jgi:uncharacterized protein (TIGR02246 family)
MKYIFFFALFASASSLAQGYDSAGVKKLIAKLEVALTKPDPRVLADLFTEEGYFTNVRDSTIYSRQKIYEHHHNLWSVTGRPAWRKVHVPAYRIWFLGNDAAAIEVRWDNIHSPAPDGTTMPDRDGVWISSLVRQKGQWYIAVARNVFMHDGTPGHELKKKE